MIGDRIKNNIKNEKGYSFIEMIVALALFSVVFLMITTIFLSLAESQRSVIATQNIQESMKFIFEVMSKEIRAAQKSDNSCAATFSLVADESTPNKVYNTALSGAIFYFKNKHDECVMYSLKNDSGVGRLEIKRDNGALIDLFVTPKDINVENLKFVVYDDDIGAFHSKQPYLTMRVDVESYGGKQIHKQRTTLQTTISSRYYE